MPVASLDLIEPLICGLCEKKLVEYSAPDCTKCLEDLPRVRRHYRCPDGHVDSCADIEALNEATIARREGRS